MCGSFKNSLTLISLFLAMFLVACESTESPEGQAVSAGNESAIPLVKYSYTGPNFTVFNGTVPTWNRESRMTGYFVVAELPPRTTTNFLDPSMHFPYPNVPKKFAFSDGARTITDADIVEVIENTGGRADFSKHQIRAFSVTTDSDGDIVSWNFLFVHDEQVNTFLTSHNSGVYGQDFSEVGVTQFGCTAAEKCTANANYTRTVAVLELSDTQAPGIWTRETVESYEGAGT